VNFQPGGRITYNIIYVVAANAFGNTCNSTQVVLPVGLSNCTYYGSDRDGAAASPNIITLSSPNIVVLALPVAKIIESERLYARYTNSSLCASSNIRLTLRRNVKVCAAYHNDWTIFNYVKVAIDGVEQQLLTEQARFDHVSKANSCTSGLLFWDETFVVDPGKILEVYGSVVLQPNSGILISDFNEVVLGSGSVVISE
jgi:hypothetical protein